MARSTLLSFTSDDRLYGFFHIGTMETWESGIIIHFGMRYACGRGGGATSSSTHTGSLAADTIISPKQFSPAIPTEIPKIGEAGPREPSALALWAIIAS